MVHIFAYCICIFAYIFKYDHYHITLSCILLHLSSENSKSNNKDHELGICFEVLLMVFAHDYTTIMMLIDHLLDK
jgi:hypothetical protein